MILIALGSNMSGNWGSPRDTLSRALVEMSEHNISILTVSSFIETAPFGVYDQPIFLNAVAVIETTLQPQDLLIVLKAIEKRAGRKATKRWGPRVLDLDIIDYNGVISVPSPTDKYPLTLPHAGIAERSFVLDPIHEIAPHWVHPITGLTAALTHRQLKGLNAN